jgi:hypothetical protein
MAFKEADVVEIQNMVEFMTTNFLQPLTDSGDMVKEIYDDIKTKGLESDDTNIELEKRYLNIRHFNGLIDNLLTKLSDELTTTGDEIAQDQNAINTTLQS